MKKEREELNAMLKDVVEKGCDPKLKTMLIELGANPNVLGVSIYDVITMPSEELVEVFARELSEKKPDMKLLKSIIEDSNIDINLPSKELDNTLLTHCVYKAVNGKGTEKKMYTELVEMLLKHPTINVNLILDEDRSGPIHSAIEDPKILKMLLDHPTADPNAQYHIEEDTWSFYPLHLSMISGRSESAKLLLEHPKINLELKYNRQEFVHFALDIYEDDGNPSLVGSPLELLLNDSRIDINKKNENGETPLISICKNQYEFDEAVELILQNPKIKINEVDKKGKTALHWACENGLVKTVKLLLERPEIKVNIHDTELHRTPLHWASKGGHKEVVRLLLHHPDIDVNSFSHEKWQDSTPLMLARTYDIIPLLLSHPNINPRLENKNQVCYLYHFDDNLYYNGKFQNMMKAFEEFAQERSEFKK